MRRALLFLESYTQGAWPPLLLASAAGWLAMAYERSIPWLGALCRPAAAGDGARKLAELLSLGVAPLAHWGLMLLAMMPPLLAQPMHHLWHRSLIRSRGRTIALFFVGYLAVWMPVVGALAGTESMLRQIAPEAEWPPLALSMALALLWQASPLKRRCLERCHRLPELASFGAKADLGCLRYGLSTAIWCAGSCWALMLIPMSGDYPGQLGAMIAVALFSSIERQGLCGSISTVPMRSASTRRTK